MTEAVVVALITLVGTIVSVYVSGKSTQDKFTAELKTQNEVQNNEIKHLAAELKKLGDFAVKIPMLEGEINLLKEKIKTANHRIEDLEQLNK